MTRAAGLGVRVERQLYSQARNHCASNAAILENTIQHVQERVIPVPRQDMDGFQFAFG